jgi:hypothetical protein
VVAIDPGTHDFVNCTNWYVSRSGRITRPEDKGKGAPQPPSYFYDAGSNGSSGISRNAASSRVCYGDDCLHGVWKGEKSSYWLGRDNHEDGGNFLFADKHVARLTQQWEGVPGKLGRGVPSVPNPFATLRGVPGTPSAGRGDPNVFTDDTNGMDHENDAYLSGMTWVGDSWVKF